MVISRLSGMGAWLLQRSSAVFMALYVPLYLVSAWGVNGYSQWLAFNGRPAIAMGNVLFFAALLFHAWVGMRDVILDYVKPLALRLVLLVVVGGLLTSLGLWVLRIYVKLSISV